MNIKFESLNDKYIDEAMDIVLSLYNKEKEAVSFLPQERGFLNNLKESLEKLFKHGKGIVAIYNNKLIGFIAGYEIDECFGKCKGIYTPLYGHGVRSEYPKSLYQKLYKHMSDKWVKNNFMTHAITFFAHDKETIDIWFWMGFGLRCVDAMREVKPIDVKSRDITIHKAKLSDIPDIAYLEGKLTKHLNQSPLFMPRRNEDPTKNLTEWHKNKDNHLWIAYRDKKPLGYMKIQPNAETFISEHKDVMNITGAFVLDDKRKSGIGTLLLGEIQQWLKKNHYSLCGVDFESFNIVGSSFWNKYFTPYTYSVVRRIDERIGDLYG
ncbi:MAG: GNAT family N-acetyltransferase [Firmicutes bacterium]|nr:GNAT family N-acetyltransferase [Bacillota bacterium]